MELKILIMEDDLYIAEEIKIHLNNSGYQNLKFVSSKKEAIQSIEESYPDLAILDIREPEDKQAGINVARFLKNKQAIPVIFLSSYPEDRALTFHTNPDAFVTKPNYAELINAIDLAIYKCYNIGQNSLIDQSIFLKNDVYIKEKGVYYKLQKEDITFVKADSGYIILYTNDRSFLISSTLNKFLIDIKDPNFFSTHRSYCVNYRHIKSFSTEKVVVGEFEIPLSAKGYKTLIQKTNRL